MRIEYIPFIGLLVSVFKDTHDLDKCKEEMLTALFSSVLGFILFLALLFFYSLFKLMFA